MVLKNAKELLNKIKSGEESNDFIEVMACPSGCAGGAGQPVTHNSETVAKRGRGLYETDKMLQLHNAHENPLIKEVYESFLETPEVKSHMNFCIPTIKAGNALKAESV
ncbi:MAG: iron hydrogenase small subunit [Ignavibacteriales bacterium]|nr:iron hydrogenase small subunit [Ignavibacteriales bacterium]